MTPANITNCCLPQSPWSITTVTQIWLLVKHHSHSDTRVWGTQGGNQASKLVLMEDLLFNSVSRLLDSHHDKIHLSGFRGLTAVGRPGFKLHQEWVGWAAFGLVTKMEMVKIHPCNNEDNHITHIFILQCRRSSVPESPWTIFHGDARPSAGEAMICSEAEQRDVFKFKSKCFLPMMGFLSTYNVIKRRKILLAAVNTHFYMR